MVSSCDGRTGILYNINYHETSKQHDYAKNDKTYVKQEVA